MDEAMKINQVQTCPQCDNHCPMYALKCGRGRDDEQHHHKHRNHGK